MRKIVKVSAHVFIIKQIPSRVVLAYESFLCVRHVVEYPDDFGVIQVPEFGMKAGRKLLEIRDFP